MSFLIKGKVALVSGGASGIGLTYVKELLRKEAKAVTIADVSKEHGKKALDEIEKEFGPNKANFVETDVTNKQNFEGAFKKTIQEYKNLDILINNAGIGNDRTWEKEVAININGVIHGMLLGMENYIPKYKSGPEGVIVNISSIAGLTAFPIIPIYTATKFGVIGMSISFGNEVHYNRTKVKVITLCPGITNTQFITGLSGRTLNETYEELLEQRKQYIVMQQPEYVAKAMVKVIEDAKTATIWVAEGGKDPYEFIIPSRESFAPK